MTDKLVNWIQILTGIALLVGLALVLIELQQAKSMTLSELTSQAYSEVMADARTLMGENPAAAIARACHHPAEVSNQDRVILDAFFTSKLAQIARLRILEDVADFGVPWELIAEQQLFAVLAIPYGRNWFEAHLARDAALAAIAEKVLTTDPSCGDYYGALADKPV